VLSWWVLIEVLAYVSFIDTYKQVWDDHFSQLILWDKTQVYFMGLDIYFFFLFDIWEFPQPKFLFLNLNYCEPIAWHDSLLATMSLNRHCQFALFLFSELSKLFKCKIYTVCEIMWLENIIIFCRLKILSKFISMDNTIFVYRCRPNFIL
jgi:hypothetical protein